MAISDDQSWSHASAYGDKTVKTPAFDWVVSKGVLFDSAFCGAPQCSPSRAAITTGRQIWQLQEASYHVGYTGKGWSLGEYKYYGRKNNQAGLVWNNKKQKVPAKGISRINYTANFFDFIKAKKEGQPFCFWYGSNEPQSLRFWCW